MSSRSAPLSRRPLFRPLSPTVAALAALLAAGLLLTACQTVGKAPRGGAASAMSSGDRAGADDDSSSAAMRRLFSPLRTRPSGR